MVFDGVEYSFVRGSDIVRDGMFLEVNKSKVGMNQQVAEVFYSDATSTFYLSCFEEEVPLTLIEELISQAEVLLPPVS